MERIRVCIGTNDGEKTADCHLGDSRYFYVYEITKEGYSFIEKRENNVVEEGHAKESKMKDVLGLLNDVHVLVSGKMSPNFKRMAAETAYQPVIVKVEQLDGAVKELVSNFEKISSVVEMRLKGDRPMVMKL